MAVYKYRAKDQEGKQVLGLVEAPTEQVAARLLREKRLYIVTLAPQSQGMSFDIFKNRLKKVGFNDMVNFTRQMATLAISGLSLPESLAIIRSQNENPALINLLQDIEHHIVSGGTFASALGRHPEVFPPVYIALIKAGEASGTLDKILNRLADTLENEREFRAKVKSAMVYPVIIIIGMIAVVFIMMTVVIPKLTEMYQDFGVSLPFATQLLVDISTIFVHWWWLMIISMVAGVYFFNRWRKTPLGELSVDALILKIPLIGDLQQKIILAEFARTLGMLIGAGIHILDGLSFLRDSLGNVVYRKALNEISKKIEKGFPMGETFAQYAIFPVIVSQMIKVGEETGKLDETLEKLSKYFEKESEYQVKNLTTAIEPIIMVVLGLGVGFIVFSIITPIYSLTNQIR